MFWKRLLFKLTLMSVIIINNVELYERKIHHRLIGGHIKLLDLSKDNDELLTLSASSSKDNVNKKQLKTNNDDGGGGGGGEEKKTLSQQVADGKYGLIQKELFNKPSKRPGLISYDNNPEIPKDNINNLGGLTKNDIWLAENHLLVLRGGLYKSHDNDDIKSTTLWPAIDNYKAPLRQVKLPLHPKIPPPFPVQLTDDGPLQILGTNTTTTLNGTFDASSYPIQSPGNFEQEEQQPYYPPSNHNYTSNIITGQTPFPISPYPPGEYKPGLPFPPFLLNGTLPPFFASLPPGAAILPPPPPPGNLTLEQYDEDDPSIYYPPPYSFYYPKDNLSVIKAGPLVPGIILPPPPNFFGPLENEITTKKIIRNRITTTTLKPQIYPTTTPIKPTAVLHENNKPINVVPSEINNELKPVITTTLPPTTTIPTRFITITPIKHKTKNRTNLPPQRTTRPLSVTILKPVKSISSTTSNTPTKIYVYNNKNNEIRNNKPFKVYGPPSLQQQQQQQTPITNSISTTQVPLKIYYSSSTKNEIEPPISSPQQQQQEQIPEIIVGRRQKYTTTKSPKVNQYYYYEEEQAQIPTRTRNYQQYQQQQQQENDNYYNIPQSPQQNYYISTIKSPPPPPPPVRQQQQQPKQPQYYFVTTRPYNSQRNNKFTQFISQNPTKSDSFSLHIARLQKQIQQYYTTTTKPITTFNRSTPKPVYQFSFQAANYQSQTQNGYLSQPFQQQQDNYQIQQQQQQNYNNNNNNNQDRFRPIPKYSVQIEPAIEIIPTQKPPTQIYYQTQQEQEQQNQPINYYSNNNNNNNNNNEDKRQYVVTTIRPSINSFELTENPIYENYYTKSDDERYLDENTKKYFSTFGQKLNNIVSSSSTTTSIPPIQNRSKIRNQQQKQVINLEGDTIVNYLNPRPNINTQAEFIEKINYHQPIIRQPSTLNQQQRNSNNNNKGPEIIKAIPVPTAEGQPGSFISYQLPGDDGAHFYFLTPQLAQRRDQGIGYYYTQQQPTTTNPRIERNGGDR